MPADTVPNSAAMLWVSQWSAGWAPAVPANLGDWRIGFGNTPATIASQWFLPAIGWIVEISNATNVPNPIPLGAHTPSTLVPSAPGNDYTQLPFYCVLNNVTSNQTIYLNCEIPYINFDIDTIQVYAPFLLYQRQ
jgi:hypothetical protein